MKLKFLLLFISIMILISCTNSQYKSNSLNNESVYHGDVNFNRFTVNLEKCTKTGFFDKNKSVVFLDTGEIFPIKNSYTVVVNYDENKDCLINRVIDSNGKFIFSYTTSAVRKWDYGERYFTAYDEKQDCYLLYDNKGKIVDTKNLIGDNYIFLGDSPSSDYIIIRDIKNNRECFFNIKLNSFMKANNNSKFEADKLRKFKNGFAVFENNDKYSAIDLTGSVFLKSKYKYLSDIYNGYFIASKKYNHKESGFYPGFGLLNLSEKWLIPPIYYDIIVASENYIYVKTMPNDKKYEKFGWKIINLKNNTEIQLDENICILNYIQISETEDYFFDGVARFSLNKKEGLISEDGTILLSPEYNEIKPCPDNGFWQVKKDDIWYIYNLKFGLQSPVNFLKF